MLPTTSLRQLMAQAASAGSLEVVYQTALRWVQEALDVERASLLVFDAGGTMRFVAWAGLSDTYRAAVDGHSPWSPGETAATPILVADVEQDPSMAGYRPVFRAEHIAALAFIPLQFGTRLLGKFMLYYRHPHAFSDTEIEVAQRIADHVAFALEHHRIAVALESRLAAERDHRQQAEAEAALRQASERRLSLALAAGGMGAWDWDILTGRVSWSTELESIHGIAAGSFAGTLEAVRRDVDPADADRLMAAITAALASPESLYEIEYRIVRPDGTRRWLGVTGRVIVNGEGSPVRMVGICRDITEPRRAADASAFLANASRLFATTLAPELIVKDLVRLVVPSLADWCIVHEMNGEGRLCPVEIAHWDERRIAPMQNLLQRWPSAAETADSAASVAESGRSVLVPRITDGMLQARARDAHELQALRELGLTSAISVPLQAHGRLLGTLTLLIGDSARLYDQADLRFAEDIASWAALAIDNARLYGQTETARGQLEALARMSDQIAVSLDPNQALKQLAARVVPAFADYCVTYATTDRGIRPLGFAHCDSAKTALLDALVSRTPIRIDDPDGPGSVIRSREPLLVADAAPATGEAPNNSRPRRDTLSWLEPRSVMTVPLNARGRTLGAIMFATTSDSGRRFGQADLKLAIELANRAALLVDNARLYAEARAAVRSRDEIAAFVSHDLRDPLQSIAAAAATLRRARPADDAVESIESIELASTQMQRLVQDLLDVSLIDAGRLTINPERVDLQDLILEAQTLLLPQLRAANAQVQTMIGDNLPPLVIDRHRILQVLVNLIGNAVKFGGAGGSIMVGAEPQEHAIRFWIQDTGAGISPEHLGRVFDRFWRADRRAGAGLGLAVVKGIVEAHGGQVSVSSQLGVGSIFFFTLPLQPEPDVSLAVSRLPAARAAEHGERRSVLLVDDDQDVVRSMARLVRSFGHDIHIAFNGPEALEVGERCQPQIVLMDIDLPGPSGYDTAREMRLRPWGRDIVLVAVTGWGRKTDRLSALKAGFDRHMTKPVHPDEIEALLNDPPHRQAGVNAQRALM